MTQVRGCDFSVSGFYGVLRCFFSIPLLFLWGCSNTGGGVGVEAGIRGWGLGNRDWWFGGHDLIVRVWRELNCKNSENIFGVLEWVISGLLVVRAGPTRGL